MKRALALGLARQPAPLLLWALLAGELSLGLAFFSGHPFPEVALRGLRLFLRF